ncbi:MAG: sulfatase [Planctomycetota bacterium]
MIRQRRQLFAFVLVLLLSSPAALLAAKKNILLFVTDDQSLDAGCYGNEVIQTPHMDALASDGTLFRYAFCTTASCSASRSVILTGVHNHANGHYGHQHHYHKFSSYENLSSLPVYLAQVGYRTARAGKFHVGPEAVYRFQNVIPGSSRSSVQLANNCEEFIKEKSEQPFFLYYCTSDPHRGGGVRRESPLKPDVFGNNRKYPGVKEVIYDPDTVIVHPFLPDTPESRAEIAEYYRSVTRLDQGLGRLVEHLKSAGVYDDTLIVFIADHGIAMPGAKTTVYEGGLHSPCLVRNPYAKTRGIQSNAMISWVDIAPTLVDFAGALDPETGQLRAKLARALPVGTRDGAPLTTRSIRRGTFQGRSFLSLLEREDADCWDEIYASHTFHEIQMYYPMRVVRERRWKLIWNIAHPLPFPFASDLWAAATWQAQYRKGLDAPYGKMTVGRYIQRPEFELFDLVSDPHESTNLASDPIHAKELRRLQEKLRAFQRKTKDPWILKWKYE